MIKLYICYFAFGALMLFYSLMASFFPPDGMVVLTNVALYASGGLYFIIPALVWYRLKLASVAGLILTACVLPFSSYWLWYRFVKHGIIYGGPDDITIFIMAVLLVVIVGYSIKYAVVAKPQDNQISIKKPFKLILALLPAILIGAYMGWFYLSKLMS